MRFLMIFCIAITEEVWQGVFRKTVSVPTEKGKTMTEMKKKLNECLQKACNAITDAELERIETDGEMSLGEWYSIMVDTLIANGVTVQKWNHGKKPPKEWKDDKGNAINFLVVIPGAGIDIDNWIEPAKCWFCLGIPCKVAHWMPLPEPPKGEEK